MHDFPAGPVSRQQYMALEQDAMLAEMQEFSDEFVKRNAAALTEYARSWTPDPLGNWSRRYEYPFVARRVDAMAGETDGLRWLDAGSGITFLPFWLGRRRPNLDITCLDSDPRFGSIFDALDTDSDNITFITGDLNNTGLADASFDLVSCISVLEHLPDPAGALGRRKPGPQPSRPRCRGWPGRADGASWAEASERSRRHPSRVGLRSALG